MLPPVALVTCPGCVQPTADITQVGGSSTYELGEEADVMCFNCGEYYVVTLTLFGWVSRPATPAERLSATRNAALNHVRTHYADYRARHPEYWS